MKLKDRAFQTAFSKLFVYNILFEDSEVDEKFLGVDEDSAVLGITGAGCGMAGLMSKRPARVDAVDINKHHLALAALKMTASQHMGDYTSFYDLFGRGWHPTPRKALAPLHPHLPRFARRYWKLHADRFKRSIHNKGLTAQFLKGMRQVSGVDGGWIRMMMPLTLSERMEQIERTFGPMRDNKIVGAFLESPVQLMALGVNYAQRDRMLAAEQKENLIDFFYDHIVKLAHTDLERNWFIWYVITGQFNHDHPDACPPYLRRSRHEKSLGSPTKVGYHHGNIFDVLEGAGRNTWSHYMFCDAPDWMPPDVQKRLLDNVIRTSRDGAVMLWRSVEDDTMVQRHGMGKHFQQMVPETEEASANDRSRQYRKVNFYRVVH